MRYIAKGRDQARQAAALDQRSVTRLFLLGILCTCVLWLAACAPAPVQPPEPAVEETAAPGEPTAVAEATAVNVDEATCNPILDSAFVGWARDNKVKFDVVATNFSTYTTAALSKAELFEIEPAMDVNVALNEHMVGFLTAHGSPSGMRIAISQTEHFTVPFDSLLLGQCDATQKSSLRYLFFSSCNVLAHGPPRSCNSASSGDYLCPGQWEYQEDSATGEAVDDEAMRSIYVRWGEKLGNGLRMLCGSSSTLTPEYINGMWQKYGAEMSLADAVVYGLSSGGAVGICLARGGDTFGESPLYVDKTFTNAANQDDNDPLSRYHLQYTKPFANTYAVEHGILVQHEQWEETVARLAWVSEASPTCLPLSGSGDEEFAAFEQAYDGASRPIIPWGDQEITFDVDMTSEAEVMASVSEDELVSTAGESLQGFLNESGLGERIVWPQRAVGTHLLLSTFPTDRAEWSQAALRTTYKSAIIEFPQLQRFRELQFQNGDGENAGAAAEQLAALSRFYDVLNDTYEVGAGDLRNDEDPLVPILNGSTLIQIHKDGSPLLVQDNWQPVGPGLEFNETVRTPLDAYWRSLGLLYEQQLADLFSENPRNVGDDYNIIDYMLAGGWISSPDKIVPYLEQATAESGPDQLPYRLRAWNFGYAPEAVDGPQDLRVWYGFHFVANENAVAGYTAVEYPPVTVWVRGQNGEECMP